MSLQERRPGRAPILRLALGVGQMGGATAAAWLLFTGGVTREALIVVVLTCGLTTMSVLLFGRDSLGARKPEG